MLILTLEIQCIITWIFEMKPNLINKNDAHLEKKFPSKVHMNYTYLQGVPFDESVYLRRLAPCYESAH
jgi:hypothetical protein